LENVLIFPFSIFSLVASLLSDKQGDEEERAKAFRNYLRVMEDLGNYKDLVEEFGVAWILEYLPVIIKVRLAMTPPPLDLEVVLRFPGEKADTTTYRLAEGWVDTSVGRFRPLLFLNPWMMHVSPKIAGYLKAIQELPAPVLKALYEKGHDRFDFFPGVLVTRKAMFIEVEPEFFDPVLPLTDSWVNRIYADIKTITTAVPESALNDLWKWWQTTGQAWALPIRDNSDNEVVVARECARELGLDFDLLTRIRQEKHLRLLGGKWCDPEQPDRIVREFASTESGIDESELPILDRLIRKGDVILDGTGFSFVRSAGLKQVLLSGGDSEGGFYKGSRTVSCDWVKSFITMSEHEYNQVRFFSWILWHRCFKKHSPRFATPYWYRLLRFVLIRRELERIRKGDD
jgi:hypothetical protein